MLRLDEDEDQEEIKLVDSLKPKVLFREHFTTDYPNQDEVIDVLCTLLDVSFEEVENAILALAAFEVD